MSEIIEYRPINEDERIEIDQLAAKGLVLIGLQESAESSAILDGIKNYLNNFESSDDEEITDRAYELGSLLGNTIQKHYGWNWFCVEENTDDSFHCVALSIIYHVDFYVFLTGDLGRDSRIMQLLDIAGLPYRVVQDKFDYTTKIDWKQVDERIGRMRLSSQNYLIEALRSFKY